MVGLLVLKDGKIVYKYLGDGNIDMMLWMLCLVGKLVVLMFVGVVLWEGKIKLFDDCVIDYELDLKGIVWDGVMLK